MEILTNLQKRLLIVFSDIPDSNSFYLTGGTALSVFYLYHRKSNDLDLFTNVEELINPFSQKLVNTLKKENIKVSTSRSFHSFSEIYVETQEESTVIHLALDSPFRFEEPIIFKEFPKLKVDSLIDIATNKVLTLFGRATFRDFVDVYFLLKEKFTKEELIEKAKLKDPGFDLYWLGVAMERINEFKDDIKDIHLLTKSCKINDLKEFYADWLKEILNQIKK